MLWMMLWIALYITINSGYAYGYRDQPRDDDVPFLNVHSPRAVTQEGARYAERESAADDIVLAGNTVMSK